MATTSTGMAVAECKISQTALILTLHVYGQEQGINSAICIMGNVVSDVFTLICLAEKEQKKHKIAAIHKWVLWLCIFVLLEPCLAVFCSPRIKLHDAETVGGQTGDSTHSAVRGDKITLLVCCFQKDSVPSC